MTLSLRELGGRLDFAGCLILLGFSYGYIAYHFKLPPDSLLRGFYATLAALFAEDTKENTAASDAFLEKGAGTVLARRLHDSEHEDPPACE